jgi:hypothetical protein
MPIRPTVQKIIGDKLVTDRQTDDRQTDRQTDIFELTPIHKGKFNFFFFAYGRESMIGVKFIPPYLPRLQGDKKYNKSEKNGQYSLLLFKKFQILLSF